MPAARAAATASIASVRGGSAMPTSPSSSRRCSSGRCRRRPPARAGRARPSARWLRARPSMPARTAAATSRPRPYVEHAVGARDRHALAVGVERLHVHAAAGAARCRRGGCRARRPRRESPARSGRRCRHARRSTARRRSTRRPPPAGARDRRPHSSRTVITPVVSVPVLSVQMTVAQPSVSTAGSRRTSTWRAPCAGRRPRARS